MKKLILYSNPASYERLTNNIDKVLHISNIFKGSPLCFWLQYACEADILLFLSSISNENVKHLNLIPNIQELCILYNL